MSKTKFKISKITKLSDITVNTVLLESDLCFQDETHIYQFKAKKDKSNKKISITPGYHVLVEEMGRLKVDKIELRSRDLLNTFSSTKTIFNEAKIFFNNLSVYEELGEAKARKILLYSQPGNGKTASITAYCKEACREDPGTVVIVWPTSKIDADYVLGFLERKTAYTKKCTRLILIMEDIGGGEREGDQGSRGVDSSLLDLLDGLRIVFSLPTFMIATTNYPQNLLSALADRPGRFDTMIKLLPPSYEERIALVEFIAKRSLNDEEKQAFLSKEAQDFSVAHLKEIVIRSLLHSKTMPQVIKEIAEHRDKFKRNFDEKSKDVMGFDV